jgi:adenylate cyclase
MQQIIIEQPGLAPITVRLSDKELRLGRSDDNDLVLTADEVSRHHATVTLINGKCRVRDLKSLNGTYVHRQRITEAFVTHLDEIWLGSKCRIVYRDDSSQPAPIASSEEVKERLAQSIRSIRQEMQQVGQDLAKRKEQADQQGATMMGDSSAFTMSPDEIARMSHAYRRLDALFRAGQAVTSNFDLQTRLSTMLKTIMATLNARRGFVMLRHEKNDSLTVEVSLQMGGDLNAGAPSMGIAGRAALEGEPVLMSSRQDCMEFGGRESIIANQITSAMCVPLRGKNTLLGSIYVDTDQSNVSFTEEDLELFLSLAAQAALAIDNVRLHEQTLEFEKKRGELSRFLPGPLVERLMNESESLTLGGNKTRVTTLFCDIRGSTHIAEQLSPQELVALLNEHFTAMTEIVFAYGGTLDKYIGDEIMAIFGTPLPTGDEEFRAVCTAVEMQHCNARLNAVRQSEGRPPLHIGIGVDVGDVIAGFIGSPRRMDFTVIGDKVNTAKRFCDMAGPGKVVVGEEVWLKIQDRAQANPLGAVSLKGKQQAVESYEILSVKRPAAGH